MSTRVFWRVTVLLVALVLAAGPFLDLSVGGGVLLVLAVFVVMFAVDAVLNVRRSWAAYRDHGDWPGES